tara:strand:- start:527 stop:2413 length:1887 start_codon:yes stop_codon:yes gene_type:complete
MPQRQDQQGWKPPSSFVLRKGQQQVIDLLSDSKSAPRKNAQLIAELPTGYGKTVVVCASYALLRSAGIVNRMLVIVPSGEQFTSYLNEIEADMSGLGASTTGALKAVSTLSLKAHKKNQAEIFVTTVQSLTINQEVITDLLATGRWLVAADEFHRYAKDNTWGRSIQQLNSVFTLAVSATPDRTDKSEKAITGKPDVCVTLKEAVEEGAIRPVVVCASDYAVDITLNGETTPRRLSTAELQKELTESGTDISAQEVKRELRYYSKYLHKAISDAHSKLQHLNFNEDGQHKMLVFAFGVGHAKSICEQFNDLAGEKVADWIGVQSTVTKEDGSSTTTGRSEPENERVLASFKAGDFNVLVQVKKATEGFNDVRCSVLLFLNLTGETVLLKQMIGRGLRRNYAVEPSTGRRAAKDKCWIFVSNDHPGLEYMKRLEDDMADRDDGDDPQKVDRDPPGDPIYGLPAFYILDAQFSGEELYYPFGEGGADKVSVNDAVQKARTGIPALATASDSDIQAELRKLFKVEPKPVSTTERIDGVRKKIVDAARLLASNVVRVRASRCAGTFPKSLLGDTIRAIHARWLRSNPKLSHNNMTVEELKWKYEWIRQLNNGMKEAADPYAYMATEAPWLLL